MTFLSRKRGFTLVELLIVVLILAALAMIAVPRIGQSAANARGRACDTNVSILNSQLELYEADEGVPPADVATITGNTDYFPDGAPTCPFGTNYVIGANGHITGHGH